MGSRKKHLSPEERQERLQAARDRMDKAVAELMTSDGWQAMITARIWLRRYSLNNLLMILFQFPEARDVRPLSQWNKVGRSVRKGEKAIRIFGPCRYKTRDEQGNEQTDMNGEPVFHIRGFKLVSVFDVSQTEGEPLPDEHAAKPQELCGKSPEQLWEHVSAQITARGFAVERGECGDAYGQTIWETRTVRVSVDVDDAQAVKTLVHELAHIACDHEQRRHAVPRALLEVEAESVACVVTAFAGLDSLAYSVPYVAGWAAEPAVAHASAERVMNVADHIVCALEETPDQLSLAAHTP